MAEAITMLQQLAAVEQAVAAGDLEQANEEAGRLRPLLLNAGIEEMFEMRERIASLKLTVTSNQAEHARELRALKHKRGGAALYQQVSRSMGS